MGADKSLILLESFIKALEENRPVTGDEFTSALARLMTKVGLSLTKYKDLSIITVSQLREFEKEYYANPNLGLALVLTAATMSSWTANGDKDGKRENSSS